MSLIQPDSYYVGMDVEITTSHNCVNCGHEVKLTAVELKFKNVHKVCPNCKNYVDVDVKNMIEKTCKHCFAKSHFLEDEKLCPKCGKDYNAKVEKNRSCNFTYMTFSTPLHGTISRTHL